MITSARFQKDYRCFKEGTKFVFRPGVNLLVGDQGAGKSSLLQLIRKLATPNSQSEVTGIFTLLTSKDAFTVYSYDFEEDNPRVAIELTNGIAMFQVQSRFKSHGQVVQAIQANITALEQEFTPCCLTMDEPDTGLSLRSVYALIQQLKRLSKHPQILAAVHNPVLIEAWPEVLSLEHRKWMSSADFLHAQRWEQLNAAKIS